MTVPAHRNAARDAVIFVLVLAVAEASAFAGGVRESDSTDPHSAVFSADYTEGDTVVLTGRVKAKGNEPFSFAVLETESGVFKLTGPKADELFREHQLETVTIRGVVAAAGEPPILPPEIEVRRYRAQLPVFRQLTESLTVHRVTSGERTPWPTTYSGTAAFRDETD